MRIVVAQICELGAVAAAHADALECVQPVAERHQRCFHTVSGADGDDEDRHVVVVAQHA
jgi:hypothetical protein